MNWYENSRKEIEKLYGDDADLFCDLLAATSPRKRIKENWKLAQQIYELYHKVQASMCAYMVQTNRTGITGIMPCHKNNIRNALLREPLSGRKVRAFAANLKGGLDPITVDVWIGRYFGFDKINDKVYDQIEYMIRSMAAACGMKPAELQAELWCSMIREEGKHPVSYADVIDKQLYLW